MVNLMLIHNLNPVLIDLGFFEIRWYSIAYVFGILLGWVYGKFLINKKYSQLNAVSYISAKNFDDLIIYLVIGIIVGGRLGYVIFYNFNYYYLNLMEIFMIWKGGMSFHGGLIGIVAASFIFGKIHKIDIFSITDIIACAAPIGIFFGRIANFINGELYGKVSTLPWSVIFQNEDNVSRHPSQIYEAIFEGLFLFIIINYFAIKKNRILKSGTISSLFLIYYSLFRILGEVFREPDVHLGYYFEIFSMGTILSIFTLIVGLLLIHTSKKNGTNS